LRADWVMDDDLSTARVEVDTCLGLLSLLLRFEGPAEATIRAQFHFKRRPATGAARAQRGWRSGVDALRRLANRFAGMMQTAEPLRKRRIWRR